MFLRLCGLGESQLYQKGMIVMGNNFDERDNSKTKEYEKNVDYDKDGYDRFGYDQYGYDREGYDRLGYDKDGKKRQ